MKKIISILLILAIFWLQTSFVWNTK